MSPACRRPVHLYSGVVLYGCRYLLCPCVLRSHQDLDTQPLSADHFDLVMAQDMDTAAASNYATECAGAHRLVYYNNHLQAKCRAIFIVA